MIQQPRLGYLDRQTTGFARPLLALLVVVGLGTAIVFPMRDAWGPTALLVVVYVPGIVLIAIRYGFWWALATILAATTVFEFAHVEPVGQFGGKRGGYVDLAALAAAAALVSLVARRASLRALEASRSRRESALLGELARRLLPVSTESDAREVTAEVLNEAFDCEVQVLGKAEDGEGAVGRRFALRSDGRVLATLVAEPPPSPETVAAIERLSPGLAAMLATVSLRVELARGALDAEALRRSDMTKTAILRAVSHDFRSPLTALSTALDVLEDGKLDEASRAKMVHVATGSTAALRNLVDNLLDLARLEADAAQPQRQWVSIEEVLGRALASEPGMAVDVELDQLPLVPADPSHLERAFINLLQNARQHAGGRGVRISGEVGSEGMVRVEMVDAGPGLDPSLGDAAFEPFRSGTPESGTGLGLAIVRGFIEANGGRVHVGRGPETGARFVVELPVEPTETTATGRPETP